MIRRNLVWRGAGLIIIAAGFVLTVVQAGDSGVEALLGLLGCVLAAVGLVLLIQGRRVAQALRVERSSHRELPLAVHRRRIGRPPLR